MQAAKRSRQRQVQRLAQPVTSIQGAAGQETREIPLGIRRAGAWAWRFIVIVASLWLIVKGMGMLSGLVIPVLVAILLTSLLNPLVRMLTQHTFLPRAAAAAIALLSLIIVVVGMFVLAGRQLVASWQDISDAAVKGFNQLWDFATTTLNIDSGAVSEAQRELVDKLQANSGAIVNGAVATAAMVGNVGTGLLIALFTLFFLLSSGHSVWRWIVGLFPAQSRPTVHEGFRRGWKALSAYVRTQVLVAAVDATGIALGFVIIDLVLSATGAPSSAPLTPYAVPIWLIVFLFSFVPLVGAVASGAIACLIALVLQGPIIALIMVGVVILVQQLESNVLQPLLMGHAVELHPLAVFLGVAGGAMIAGITGALFAIPFLAFINALYLFFTGRDPAPDLGVDETAQQHYRELERRHKEFLATGVHAADQS
ncbi:AI-2E family transporter [Helcobacillus massiliensis]|uniref:Putative PurR-regulated permease PerM n=1 Tax=Helcobacillus massiliensis TaxID=521392 RepID=A0A839QTB2_9MICO|nr:AI-2E family transporter [Helcobacillus massiliensis]MBB3022878.1 putative PurR-regulated permease PerM [Helcobacillus massiliensis]